MVARMQRHQLILTAKADISHRSRRPCPLYIRKRTCAVQLGMSALGQKRTSAYSITSSAHERLQEVSLRLLGWPDLRRPHWLGHAEKDHDTLASAAGRQC